MAEHAPSLYAASANPFPACPALEGEASADVVVVGGGFAGLSAALHAAEAGFSVVLLEARRIGWGASGRNGGQMVPGLRWSVADLIDRFGEGLAGDLLHLADEANRAVRARIARHAIACDLRDGHFLAAARPAHMDGLRRDLDLLETRFGYQGAAMVEQADLPAVLASPIYAGGLIDRNGGHLHPLNYALGLGRAALEAGVRVHEHSAVTAIETTGPVIASTARGRVKARFAVLACDSEMGGVAPAEGRMIMPVANYNIATVPLGAEAAAALIPSGAAVADTRFVLNYFRLSADHRLIFSGGEKYSPTPPPDIPAFVRPHLERVFPQLRGVGIDYGWGGIVGVTRNRLPRFGRQGQAFFAHGWSGQGVLLTTLAGQLIAEAMRGTAARFDLFASLPHQPFPGGALLRHPLYVAAMLYYALRDRL